MSPHLADLVLLVMLAEALALRAIWRRPLSGIAMLLLPGAFLVLALRQALAGDGWAAILVFLTLALFAHLADLRHRLRA